MSTDPYTYPGTDVLRNLRDIREPETLAQYEAGATGRRITELVMKPLRGQFDVRHLRAIHRHIFQDVFRWAGEFRTVNISKGGQLFGMCAFVESALNELFSRLAKESHLRGLDHDAFAARAGFYLSELNAIHPFREGNGRTQREFIRELGRSAGCAIDWGKVTRDQMTAASIESFLTGKSPAMARLIELALTAPADN